MVSAGEGEEPHFRAGVRRQVREGDTYGAGSREWGRSHSARLTLGVKLEELRMRGLV